MSRWLRSVVLVLACAHLMVATVPCGSTTAVEVVVTPPAVSEPMSHSASSHHGSPNADFASPMAHDHGAMPGPARDDADSGWKAPCPCGCDRSPGSDLPGHKLDPGLLLARIIAPVAFERVLHAPTARVPIFA
ncbi:MAG: hypothetical protein JRG83_04975 [Deltaproteobacteria bacterium]|nr:hypothetical protein [Deltaproteobacteria bacterium]